MKMAPPCGAIENSWQPLRSARLHRAYDALRVSRLPQDLPASLDLTLKQIQSQLKKPNNSTFPPSNSREIQDLSKKKMLKCTANKEIQQFVWCQAVGDDAAHQIDRLCLSLPVKSTSYPSLGSCSASMLLEVCRKL